MNLLKSKKIIIKIGSALLIDGDGRLRTKWVQSVCEDIADLKQKSVDVILVSSGSIGLGKDALNIKSRPLRLDEKQAAAACGQLALINNYEKHLNTHGLKAAQILLTLEDSENRRRYLNARNTINILLKRGIVPIINENDTISTDEIRFGDNDRLAARIAQMVEAEHLILLSDVDGLYDANPHSHPEAKHIAVVENIDQAIENMADGISSNVGSGGMKTKIMAAKIAASVGCHTIITSGKDPHPIKKLLDGSNNHTLFKASEDAKTARKNWIAHTLKPSGSLSVDNGAEEALSRGKSLLPAGVTNVEGDFERGDAVTIKNAHGAEVARGLVAFSAEEAKKILGRKTSEIETILQYDGRTEMIHRSDLVMVN